MSFKHYLAILARNAGEKEGGPMGAIANSPRLQMPAATAKQTSTTFRYDPETLVRMMSLNEARQLSHSSSVIVLVPLPAEKQSLGSREAALEFLAFSDKSTTQSFRRETGRFVFGDIIVDFAAMEVSRSGKPVKVTALEFKALKYLIQNPRRPISREEFLNEVWGYNNYPTTRTVDNQLSKLRKKLEREPSRPVHLQTVHGTGYKFLP
jgi:Transcriptional regulatory protein, C terminal